MISVNHLYQLAVEANKNGDNFPIWGTCMGFQTLNVLTNGDASVLSTGFDSEDYAIPLVYTGMARTR